MLFGDTENHPSQIGIFLWASLIAAAAIITTHERTHLVSRCEPAAVGRPREGEDVLAVRAALVARRLRVDVPEPHRVVARAGGLQGDRACERTIWSAFV